VLSLPPETPLYNHPLHRIEDWLRSNGCAQDQDARHCWSVQRGAWLTTIYLEETALRAEYEHDDVTRTLTFPYSLSRSDVEQAVFHADML
jgi:Protein of unknown function (DUF3143)